MSTLSEIEEAAARLSPEQKQELILFLAARLRADGAEMPSPRKYSREEMDSWVARDEADMEDFRRGASGAFLIRACSLLRPLLIEVHHEKSSGWRRETSGS